MKIVKYILLCAGLFLLLFGKSDSAFSRSDYALWDLGHIIIWALGTHLLVFELKLFSKKRMYTQFILIGCIAMAAGMATEIMQFFTERSADINDLFKDLTGVLTGLLFFNQRKNQLPRLLLRLFQGVVIVLLMMQSVSFIKACTDEMIARIQFPVLSNFETPFEQERWTTKGSESISGDMVYEGGKAFKVELRPEKYAGLSLEYFPSDWSGYEMLEMNLYNPSTDTLHLHIRIDDKDHKLSGYAYADRFNASYDLSPGWNTIHINLDKVKNAPQSREMDLQHMDKLSLFFIQPADWLTVYIDEVKLIK